LWLPLSVLQCAGVLAGLGSEKIGRPRPTADGEWVF
jgi:hypothetical protein